MPTRNARREQRAVRDHAMLALMLFPHELEGVVQRRNDLRAARAREGAGDSDVWSPDHFNVSRVSGRLSK
jgi:hypothetical protein